MHAPYEVRFCLGLQKAYRSSSGETAKNSITSEVTGHVYNPLDVQAQQRRLICACKIHTLCGGMKLAESYAIQTFKLFTAFIYFRPDFLHLFFISLVVRSACHAL